MLTEGAIEECDSSYAAPVIFIPKKDDQCRLCVDYRNLNAMTFLDRYPMAVAMKEANRDNAAFITLFVIYRFVK